MIDELFAPPPVPAGASAHDLEEGTAFTPRFDADGLIVCVARAAGDHEILMIAYMNAEALRLTLATGEAHYWSRSRQSIWRKGATSGQIQKVTGNQNRLRPGRPAPDGRGWRRRRRLPHRATLLLLPPRRGRRRAAPRWYSIRTALDHIWLKQPRKPSNGHILGPSRRIGEVSGGTPLKKVYLAYALLALVVILLLYAQLSHAPA